MCTNNSAYPISTYLLMMHLKSRAKSIVCILGVDNFVNIWKSAKVCSIFYLLLVLSFKFSSASKFNSSSSSKLFDFLNSSLLILSPISSSSLKKVLRSHQPKFIRFTYKVPSSSSSKFFELSFKSGFLLRDQIRKANTHYLKTNTVPSATPSPCKSSITDNKRSHTITTCLM